MKRGRHSVMGVLVDGVVAGLVREAVSDERARQEWRSRQAIAAIQVCLGWVRRGRGRMGDKVTCSDWARVLEGETDGSPKGCSEPAGGGSGRSEATGGVAGCGQAGVRVVPDWAARWCRALAWGPETVRSGSHKA